MVKQLDLVKKFRSLPWQVWLKRYFPMLVTYSMVKNATQTAFAQQGLVGEWPLCLFEGDAWYGNDQMFSLAGEAAKKFLKKANAQALVNLCEYGYQQALAGVEKMNKDKKTPPLQQYQGVLKLLEPINVSIWTAHASEVYYHRELCKKLAKYVAPADMEKFIGDIGFPARKNAHALMVEEILAGVSIHTLHKRYSWLKSRTDAGFSAGYTLSEMNDLKKSVLKNPPQSPSRPSVPASLQKMVEEFQDIVYLRTLRTDSLFEIYFRAKPIFDRVCKYFGIDSIIHYMPDDLLAGKIERYDGHYAILKYYDQIVVTREKIVQNQIVMENKVKGVVAFAGQVTGKVKIIFNPNEIKKIEKGDILVTNMTIPAYLLGMRKAAGIVTDEGGITCHAAILSRELKKPCVIGTKIATKVFKDGDLVEVDAEKGIVKKI